MRFVMASRRGRSDGRLRRRGRATALLLAGALVLAACGGSEEDPGDAATDEEDGSDDAADGGDGGDGGDGDDSEEDPAEALEGSDELRIRMTRDMTSLDPNVMPATEDDAIAMNVLEGLVAYEPGGSGELVNVLAEEIEESEDGTEIDFTLKEGIQFHGDYGEVTAEDVKFSFERVAGLTDSEVESSYASDWETLEEVEVTGDYTGTIHLSDPFPPLMINTLPGNAGLIVPQEAVEELGEDFGTQPVGTGPYEFVEWTPNSEVVLERFDDYSGASDFAEPPEWERIVFLPIEDESAADVAVETGEVNFGEISASAVERFEEDEQFTVNPQPTFDYGWIGMNVQDELLSDIHLRRAIRAAIDVDGIIEAGFEGQVERANALISPEMPIGHWEDAPEYGGDLEAAQEHLDQADVEPPLELTFTIDDQQGAQEAAEIAQANLAELGIELEIDQLDQGEFRDVARDAQTQLFFMSFSNSADPSWATVWFSCDQVGDWNYMHWCNEDYQELHEAALTETDQDARHDMYVEMQQLMDEDAIASWVHYRTKFYAYPPSLEPSLVPERYGKYLAWDFRR